MNVWVNDDFEKLVAAAAARVTSAVAASAITAAGGNRNLHGDGLRYHLANLDVDDFFDRLRHHYGIVLNAIFGNLAIGRHLDVLRALLRNANSVRHFAALLFLYHLGDGN